MEDVTFFITRHVNSPLTNNYWQLCYLSIRKFYKKNKIIIIDDNSNRKFLKKSKMLKLTNTQIIKSEYPRAGELLPYYYFHKLKPSKKMIFLHDSMFLIKKYNENRIKNINDVSYHFYFNNKEWNNNNRILEKISKLNDKEELIKVFKREKWWGCFGVSSIITLDFIEKIQEKYNIFNLLQFIKSREDRMDIERIFAVCCFLLIEKNNFYVNRIHNMPGCFKIKFKKINKFYPIWHRSSPILKYWSGR